MTEATQQIRVGEADVALFSRFSHDRNPLHTNADYARRTSYGTIVAHGMLAALRLLIVVCGDRQRQLTRLKLTFRAAIHPGSGYAVDWREEGEGSFTCVLRRGDASKLIMRGECGPDSTPRSGGLVAMPTAPHLEPLDIPPTEGQYMTGAYWGEDPALGALLERAGRSSLPIPAGQAHALGLVSYVAGMLIPGRQALLLGATLEFPGSNPHSGEVLEFQAQVGRLDRRFGRVWVEVQASRGGIVELKGMIEVGIRPSPAPFQFRPTGANNSQFATARITAIITGGTRGLGAHLVGALADRGASTLATFRTGSTEAQELLAQLSGVAGSVKVFQGDLADPAASSALLERSNVLGDLNLLILNATGPIRRIGMGELEEGELEAGLSHALRITMNPLRALLPRVASNQGTVVFISSIYAREAPEGFGHYVASKCLVESLLRVLAKERPTVRFVIVRPPRMKTDQTAAVFSMEHLYDPVDVAAWILHCIETAASTPGVVQEFDFDPQTVQTHLAIRD